LAAVFLPPVKPQEIAKSSGFQHCEPCQQQSSKTAQLTIAPPPTNEVLCDIIEGPKVLADKYKLSQVEADELHKLLKDMFPLDFTTSKELSEYITSHQLGYKYPNISGIVKMKEEEYEWDFHGGFPKKIYAIVCRELKLISQGTKANAIKFTPFKEVQSSGKK
jgi:hypothetical protein